MYIAIANAIYSSTLQGSGGGFPKACFGLDYNAITSDFTFTRNSFATRVNEFGLIETVTNLGSDLVQNGSFENGDTDWDLGSNWSIENNVATTDGTQGYLVQTGTPPIGTSGTYKFEWTQEITSGTRFRIFPRNGNDTSQSGVTIVSGSTTGSGSFSTGGNCVGSGTFTAYIETTNGFSVKFLAESGNEGTIDNVSVVEVIEDDTPRIDYTTGEAAFLLEPISTNSIDYSNDFVNGWINLGATETFVSGEAPDGNTSVYELTSDGGGGKLQKGISGLAINTEYTFSFYVKQTSPTTLVQSRVLSLTGGSGGSNLTQVNYQDQLITDEWVRVTHTFTTNDTLGDYIVYVSNSLTSGESLQFFGAQLEALSYATSYIPTSGTTVTRAQESCVDATPTINSEEGVLYAEISALADDGTIRIISLSEDANVSNRINISYTSGSNKIKFVVRVNNSNVFIDTITLSNILDYNKVALRYGANNFAIYINGVKESEQLSGSTYPSNTLDKLNFDQGSGNYNFYGRTKDLRVYCKALTDDELTELTTI